MTPNNLLNILRQTAIIAMMAVAMTFVIACRDRSLRRRHRRSRQRGHRDGRGQLRSARRGSCRSHGGVWSARSMAALVARLGIPSFLVTLGMMGVAVGTASGSPTPRPADPVIRYNIVFGSGHLGPFPLLSGSRSSSPSALSCCEDPLRPPGAGHRRQRAGRRFSGVNTADQFGCC